MSISSALIKTLLRVFRFGTTASAVVMDAFDTRQRTMKWLRPLARSVTIEKTSNARLAGIARNTLASRSEWTALKPVDISILPTHLHVAFVCLSMLYYDLLFT
jgi:hypothetical protein